MVFGNGNPLSPVFFVTHPACRAGIVDRQTDIGTLVEQHERLPLHLHNNQTMPVRFPDASLWLFPGSQYPGAQTYLLGSSKYVRDSVLSSASTGAVSLPFVSLASSSSPTSFSNPERTLIRHEKDADVFKFQLCLCLWYC